MRAFKQSPAVDVVEVLDRPAFHALEKEWNFLVEETCDEPFYRHEYIRNWIDNFAPQSAMKILTGRNETGRLVAALPLVVQRGFMYGIPVRQLISPTNVDSFRFDLLAEDGESAARAFLASLAADPHWDVLRITDVPAGGNAWHLHDAALESGFPAGAWESQRSPYMALPPCDLSAKFKANLRRRRRRLEEQGEVRVECVPVGADLQDRLDESFAIEQSGWKGKNGTAATQHKETHGFYSGLARAAAAQDYLSLYVLRLNGKPIASQYGLTRAKVFSLLRTNYDESFSAFSPGHLLLEDVLTDCASQGIREFDFLGCDLEWKLDWSKIVRPHHWIFVYRNNSLGRLLRNAKFDWIPAAKAQLGRWRGHGDART